MGFSHTLENSDFGRDSIRKRVARLSKNFHSQIDQTTLMVNLVKPTLTRELYLQCLVKLAEVHIPVEAAISSFFATHATTFNWKEREKAALLLADVALLTGKAADSVPAVKIPPITDLPTLAGYLYVVEGSTLGGSYIAANLDKTLHIGPNNGGAFFNVYGDRVGLRWDQLWSFIEAQVSAEQLPLMLASAEYAFSLFLNTLQQIYD